MENWVMVDQKDLMKKIGQKKVKGVGINLFLSPYDIPEAVKGDYDEKAGQFIISFNYFTGVEDLQSEITDKNVTLKVGKNSNRIYKIVINVKALGAKVVQLALLKEVINNFEARSKSRNVENYEVAKRILSENQKEIFKQLEIA